MKTVFIEKHMRKNIKEETNMSEVKFVNCTPHEIAVYADSEIHSFPVSGVVARVNVTTQDDGLLVVKGCQSAISVVRTQYGEVDGLPDPADNTVFIVSGVVLTAIKGSRDDVLAPDTSPTSVVRDDEGRIIAVKRFTR